MAEFFDRWNKRYKNAIIQVIGGNKYKPYKRYGLKSNFRNSCQLADN